VSEPSEEAIENASEEAHAKASALADAQRLLDHMNVRSARIAQEHAVVAFQKLIDERATAVANKQHWEERSFAMAGRIDDLSRELTAEIEAHRVTRERAEAAENALHCLIEEVHSLNRGQEWNEIDEILAKYRGKP
jgi:hypothetical protein